jgi:hypothetical protein
MPDAGKIYFKHAQVKWVADWAVARDTCCEFAILVLMWGPIGNCTRSGVVTCNQTYDNSAPAHGSRFVYPSE